MLGRVKKDLYWKLERIKAFINLFFTFEIGYKFYRYFLLPKVFRKYRCDSFFKEDNCKNLISVNSVIGRPHELLCNDCLNKRMNYYGRDAGR